MKYDTARLYFAKTENFRYTKDDLLDVTPLSVQPVYIDQARQVIKVLDEYDRILPPSSIFEKYNFPVDCIGPDNDKILQIIACTCKLNLTIIQDKPYDLKEIVNNAIDISAILANANNFSNHSPLNAHIDTYPLSIQITPGTLRAMTRLINDISVMLWPKDDCHHNFQKGHTSSKKLKAVQCFECENKQNFNGGERNKAGQNNIRMLINDTSLKIAKLMKFMKGQPQIDIDDNDLMYRGLRAIVSNEF